MLRFLIHYKKFNFYSLIWPCTNFIFLWIRIFIFSQSIKYFKFSVGSVYRTICKKGKRDLCTEISYRNVGAKMQHCRRRGCCWVRQMKVLHWLEPSLPAEITNNMHHYSSTELYRYVFYVWLYTMRWLSHTLHVW